MKPLLSVAIATKNREQYCIAAIQSILDYRDERIEIAVADNSATTLVKEYIENLNSTQVKYRYDGGGVSSIENFNRAVELTSGEYVLMIGDDDSILPNAVDVALWAKENDADSICSNESVVYYWPNSIDIYANGHLTIPVGTSEKEAVNVKKNLVKLLKNGIQHYLLYPLPKTYHGIVKKDVLDKIKAKTGHYYGGLSPDTYSCIAVSCIARNHYIINEPISIAGVCATSTTADNFSGKHSGTVDNIPHLQNRPNYVWNVKVPKYYSVNTIWAESGLKALEELGEIKYLQLFNMYQLMAQGWVNNYKFIPDVIKKESGITRKSNQISNIALYAGLSLAFSKIVLNKIAHTLKAKFKSKKYIVNNRVIDIQEAINIYSRLSK